MENKVKKFLSSLLNEEKALGLKNTEDVQHEEDKVNKDYYKEVDKKMKDYDSDIKGGDKPVKFNAEDEDKDYHDEVEIRNGQEMLKYDNEPSESFNERAVKAIEGDSTMGNETKTGEWNPETGEGNGNTEPVWGASDAEFGKKLVKTIKTSNKKRDDAETPIKQFGDDIELEDKNAKTVGKSKKVAVESVDNKTNTIEPKMKRLRFKKSFGGVEYAMKLIPESYRVDDKMFEMTDGNETYKVKWEGSLTEGRAIIISGENTQLVNENIAKMKHLFGYKSSDTIAPVKGADRIVENTKFNELLNKTKALFDKTTKDEE